MLNKKIKSASIVVIGNEILSGRTQDKNINYIAKELFKSGILLKYVCVIPDEKKIIVNEIRRLKRKFDFIIHLFPFNCSWRFRTYVINYPIHTFNSINNFI